MRRIVSAVLIVSLGLSLSGCFAAAVGVAGAEGGYIYKEKEQQHNRH